MKIGVPTETKDNEYRVGIVPSGVEELVRHGHEVLIQEGAGEGSAISDEEFREAGASILPDAKALWKSSELIMKVKEPLPSEYDLMKKGQLLFAFLHLAPLPDLVDVLIEPFPTLWTSLSSVGSALSLMKRYRHPMEVSPCSPP
jgi:alanine dehydrogenase